MSKPDLLVTGEMMDLIDRGVEKSFTVHRLHKAGDREALLKKIAPEANPEDVAPGENLREALDIDSFDFLNLLIGLHETLGVEIPEGDYGKLTTLNHLVSYLSQRLD